MQTEIYLYIYSTKNKSIVAGWLFQAKQILFLGPPPPELHKLKPSQLPVVEGKSVSVGDDIDLLNL